jgi:hypothetical protein
MNQETEKLYIRSARESRQARVVRRILGHLGLPTEVPAARPSRAPPRIPFARAADHAVDDIATP